MTVFYSEEDGGYIAQLLEFPSLSAFGWTEEIAQRELERASAAWLDPVADEAESTDPFPEPATQ